MNPASGRITCQRAAKVSNPAQFRVGTDPENFAEAEEDKHLDGRHAVEEAMCMFPALECSVVLI
jgi:hypothetical protein